MNRDLHGYVPDTCPVVLLLVDVINDLEFPGGELLAPHALRMATRLRALKRRCRAAGIPAVYVNDNFGRWRSDFSVLVRHCLDDGVRGEALVRRLKPGARDYFVLKPKHSGFFSTTLATLIEYLGAHTVIVTGVAGDICVLFTANDAYMRDLHVVVPADCVASNFAEDNRRAVELMARVLKADVTPSTELDLDRLRRRHRVKPAR